MSDRPLVVGSWPGPTFNFNDFVREYAGALELAGCRIVDVPDPVRLCERIDVLHIHWPEQLLWRGGSVTHQTLRILRTLNAIAKLRRRGVKIVWMVHNLRPHEHSGSRGLLWRMIAGVLPHLVDGAMTLSAATLPLVEETFPQLKEKPMKAVRHPPFPGSAPAREEARTLLSMPRDSKVLAMLGFLRPYKGADNLLRSFRALPGDDLRLIVAGRCVQDYAARLQVIAAGDTRITLRPEAIDDDDLLRYTAAADWIVLPFRDYLHSGSMVHALSFGRAVLTPRAPFAEDMAAIVADGAVRMYEGALTAETLASLPNHPPRPDLSAVTPASIGEEARRFYETL